MSDTQRWGRTMRLAPGEDWRDGERARRTPGPWHADQGGSRSWCAARIWRMLATEQVHLPTGEMPEGRVCDRCLRAMEAGVAVSMRSRAMWKGGA